MNRSHASAIGRFRAAALCTALLLPGLALRAGEVRGFVDGSVFKKIAGEEAVMIEVSISSNLLKIFKPTDLDGLISGLDSIQAVVLDLSELDQPERKFDEAVETIRELDRQLQKRGWERLAMVKEGSETVRVLVLTDEQLINGLVVMVAEESEIVFANIAGVLDLQRIREIGEQFEVPGLDKIEDPDDDDR